MMLRGAFNSISIFMVWGVFLGGDGVTQGGEECSAWLADYKRYWLRGLGEDISEELGRQSW